MKYKLEKKIWTDTDFDQMGWHDCLIYKIHHTEDLELDIDYILQWNKPDLEGLPFTFWVAPATLAFKRVKNLDFEFDTAFHEEIEIEDIERQLGENGTTWAIITEKGDLKFMSEGYEQFIRQEPFFQFGQTIPKIERNGLSLERATNQKNPNRFRDDFIEQRKRDLKLYENVKKRHLKRQEKASLNELRESNKISIKEYLIKKREIKEMLDHYDNGLRDTKFESW